VTSPAAIRDWRGIPASQIAPLLWQSGAPQPISDVAAAGFSAIVFAADDLQPSDDELAMLQQRYPRLEILRTPMVDTERYPLASTSISLAVQMAQKVTDLIRGCRPVLVTCVAGRNRSGLISGLVLREISGMTGREASKHIRYARAQHLPPGEEALSNDAFRDFLESQP
jgi:hypothetical protein